MKLAVLVLSVIASFCAPAWALPVAQREFDLVLRRTPDVKNGASIYETCAACHGASGEGVGDGTVPVLAGQSFNVLAKQLVDFRAGQRADPRMAHFAASRHLAYSQHIADVAAYIASLPPPRPKKSDDAGTRSHGLAIYARSCERCHGPSGEGKGDFLAPRLASQHAKYLSRQLEDAAEGRRPAMSETHGPLVRTLTDNDIRAVTGYLESAGR
jgi:cytochrome c oxidase subunit 2